MKHDLLVGFLVLFGMLSGMSLAAWFLHPFIGLPVAAAWGLACIFVGKKLLNY